MTPFLLFLISEPDKKNFTKRSVLVANRTGFPIHWLIYYFVLYYLSINDQIKIAANTMVY